MGKYLGEIMIKKCDILVLMISIIMVQVYLNAETMSNRMAVEKFFHLEKKSDFKLSPDGNYISYIEYDNSNKNLMIRSTANKINIQLVYHTKNRIYKYFWINNTQLVLSVDPGFYSWKENIYSVDIKNKKIKCLTDFSGGIGSEIISVNSQKGDEIMIKTNNSDVYMVNINTGKKQLVYLKSKNLPGIYRYFADNSGKLRLAWTSKSILIFNSKKSDFENLITLQRRDKFYPKFFSKNNNIVYAYSSVARDKIAIVEFDLKKKRETIILEDPNFDIRSREERNDSILITSDFYYSQKKQKLVYAYYCADKYKQHFFDSYFKTIIDSNKNKIGESPFSIESFSKNSEKIIIKVFSDQIKGNFYLLNKKTGEITMIHKLNESIGEISLAKTYPVSYQARDGLRIHGYITKPNIAAVKKLPVIVCVHGGPILRDTPGYNDITQLLANKGYLVFQVNYRGSSGYGKKFTLAGYKQWGRKSTDDVIDGINWLIKKGMVDKSKIAIYGFSSGAHVALSGIMKYPDLFACCMSICGNVNLVSSFKVLGKGFQLKYGDPVKDKVMLMNNSPLFNVKKIKTPLLMINGAKDTSIPILEVDEFVNKLKLKGNEVEYINYENHGHNFLYKNDMKKEVFNKILNYLEKYINNNIEE